MANWGSIANAAGMAVSGYAKDKERIRAEALQAQQAERQQRQDAILQAVEARRAAAPGIISANWAKGVGGDADAQALMVGAEPALASRFQAPERVTPERPDALQVVDGQVVNLPKATSTPIAGFVPKKTGPTEAQQATAARTRDAREDRLQQNFQGEPAVKHAGALSNAVMQLRASAAQKTPQGDLNMLYGAVKLRDPNAVREGELALNNKARSLHTQLFSFFDRVRQGRILTDEERQQVMDLVGQTIEEQSKIVAPVQARYGAQARQVGADSSFVAPDPFAGARSGSRPPGFKP